MALTDSDFAALEAAKKRRQTVDEIQLTDRELLIAKKAARIAMEELSNQFYRQVGHTVITKVLVWIGMLAVGFGAARGWLNFK